MKITFTLETDFPMLSKRELDLLEHELVCAAQKFFQDDGSKKFVANISAEED